MLQSAHLPLLLKRGIRRGFLNIRRERGWGGVLGALLGVFLLVQCLILIYTGVEAAQTLLTSRTDFRLEVRPDAQAQATSEFFSALQQLPFVEETAFISKEQAYERMREQDPELISFLENFGLNNPFPDSIGVTLTSLDHYSAFASFIKQAEWQNIIDPTFLSKATDQEKNAYELLKITKAGRIVTLSVIGIVAATLIFIIMELSKGRASLRKDEVLIEQLVGAKNVSILTPFITEAVVLCYIAIAISTAIAAGLVWLLPVALPDIQGTGALATLKEEMVPLFTTLLPILFAGELLLIPIIASIGTWFGMRTHMSHHFLGLARHG